MPTYLEMIVEALLALKERSGSSLQSLKKYILSVHPDLTFAQHRLRAALKQGVDSGTFVKIKASYKLSPAGKTAAINAKKPKKPTMKVVKKKSVVKKKKVIKTKATTLKKPKKAPKALKGAGASNTKKTPKKDHGRKRITPKKATNKQKKVPKKTATMKKTVSKKA